jgi:hypothetical protein
VITDGENPFLRQVVAPFGTRPWIATRILVRRAAVAYQLTDIDGLLATDDDVVAAGAEGVSRLE